MNYELRIAMMKRKIIIAVGFVMLLGILPAWTQPKARAAAQEEEKAASNDLSVRAQSRYPRSKELPQDVVWTREIYRTLDLTKEGNGALYYPVEPLGDRMNLFSLIFKLLATKKVPAYEYTLDGIEHLTTDKEVKFRDVLDRFGIYYEQKKLKNRKDSVLMIDNSDVPSAEVKSYFIKEIWYFDQRTSTYGSLIAALCPVLSRSEDFSDNSVKLPMFWINYQELAPYLSGAMIMASDLNNVANRSIDDFFVSRQYKGDIYKTTNLQNRPLAEYCKTDSAMIKEQKRIEAELTSFEKTLYGSDTLSVAPKADVMVASKKGAKEAVKEEETSAANGPSIQTEEKAKTNSKKKGRDRSASSSVRQSSSKSNSSAAPKASVRRQRR